MGINTTTSALLYKSGAPGLVDRVFAVHAGSRGFDSHRRRMSERLFRSNRPGYLHPVYSELENSGIRVAVGDCSVTERRRWRSPYQTTYICTQTHYKHDKDGRSAPGEPLGEPHYANWTPQKYSLLYKHAFMATWLEWWTVVPS